MDFGATNGTAPCEIGPMKMRQDTRHRTRPRLPNTTVTNLLAKKCQFGSVCSHAEAFNAATLL